jgi:subtilisin family serine protease
LNLMVGLIPGGTVPGRIKVVVEDDGAGSTIDSFATNSATIQGHPGAAGAMAIGAAFFLNTPACGAVAPTLEYFSSLGGDPILFDSTGKPQAAVVRQKPDFVGPDGGNDTFLGFTLASQNIPDNSTIAGCQNNAKFPNFFGTSAATPHIASIAALFLQANPTLTLTQLYDALSQTALPIGAAPNYSAGWGMVQADAAAGKIPATIPPVPTLTLGANSIMLGGSTSLTWSSANNQGCTATGTWTGAQASSGSQNVTPTAVGSYPYSLACTNNAGISPMASVTLTVTAAAPAPSGGGGGGGALGLTTLLALGAMRLIRVRRSLRVKRCSSTRPAR